MDKQKTTERIGPFIRMAYRRGEVGNPLNEEELAGELYDNLLPHIGIPKGLTLNCVCGESISLDAAFTSYRVYRADDLTEIRATLDLPDDTPEPLVGIIWRLQQRIEDLEQKAGSGLSVRSEWRLEE